MGGITLQSRLEAERQPRAADAPGDPAMDAAGTSVGPLMNTTRRPRHGGPGGVGRPPPSATSWSRRRRVIPQYPPARTPGRLRQVVTLHESRVRRFPLCQTRCLISGGSAYP